MLLLAAQKNSLRRELRDKALAVSRDQNPAGQPLPPTAPIDAARQLALKLVPLEPARRERFAESRLVH